MNSITLKNLWARKKQNAWIFIELIVFTFVTWMVIEPVTKDIYRRMLPRGYEPERMVVVDISFTDDSKRYMPEYYLPRFSNLTDVECASATANVMYSTSDGIGLLGYIGIGYLNGDTVAMNPIAVPFDYDYFNTHGIFNVRGDKVGMPDKDKIVVSRTFAEKNLGSVDVVGKEIRINSYNMNPNIQNDFNRIYDHEYAMTKVIADVVEDVRYCAASNPNMGGVAYQVFYNEDSYGKIYNRFLLRLKAGVDPNKFIEEHKREIEHIVKGENDDLVTSIAPAEEYNKEAENKRHLIQPIRTRKMLVVFFLLNLVLGVIGTFWLHAKKRSEETGIMKAFGATQRSVVWAYIKEGWVMVTVAFVIAGAAYFNVAINNTIEYGNYQYLTMVDRFWSNFFYNASIVYVIMLTVVAAGIVIPTMKMSKSKATDLLK